MKFKLLISLCALLLMLFPLAYSQSKETGAIAGTVIDEENVSLPGVTVTLTGTTLMGKRTAITDADGFYRFPALPPGLYTVKAELQGFATVIRKDIRLHTTIRLTVDLTMKIATVEEEITVIAKSPTVDAKTSETASVTLSDEILRNMPTFQFSHLIVNLAPGVDQNVAYGASSGSGISYQLDGVDVSSPSGEGSWVWIDFNIVEEAKVVGLGLNAEYGAFSGVIFNTITKSGGNEFSGHAEFIYQHTKKGFWTAENNANYIDDFPELESPVTGLLDTSFHLGGPLRKDKIWFFLGAQWYDSKVRPAGFQAPDFMEAEQPRAFLKITSQPSSNLNLMAFFEYDAYNGINGYASATHPTPETCVEYNSAEYVGNFNLTAILNPTTFIDVKGAFFIGYIYADPQSGMNTTAYWDASEYVWKYNSRFWYKLNPKRFQVNTSVSHYAEDFIKGNHDFKFGIEFEYGSMRTRYGFTGQVEGIGNSVWIYNYSGYLYAYQYAGYDTDLSYTRNEFYAQDAWSISNNLTLNFGVRFSLNRGYSKDISGAVYKTSRFAPRFGFAWDILGDHTTVFKAHYGRYSEAMRTAYHDRLGPADHHSDYVGYYEWGGVWYEWFRTQFEELYSLQDGIKHPYLDQFTIGIERELFKDASLGVSFIYRHWKNIIGVYDTEASYTTRQVQDPYTTDTYTVYDIVNVGDYNFVIGNIKKGDPWILDDAYRKYWGIEVLFNKRFSNRWQLLASYIYSRCTGTIGNRSFSDMGWGGGTYDPNFWINREGYMPIDPTHMLKLQGTYILPFNIYFNAYFNYKTGNAFTRSARYRLNQGIWTILTEKRGSHRYPDRMNLDLRLEKTFRFAGKYRVGLMIDIFNVFNDNAVTSWGTTAGYDWFPHEYVADAPGPDGHVVYGLVLPRAIRLGIRFFF